jgi:hypothetical protein
MENIKKSIGNNPLSSLTQKINTSTIPYANMILLFGVFFIILITLYFAIPKGFNKGLGQSTFLTVTLFYFLFVFIKFYNTFTKQGSYLETNYFKFIYIGGGLLLSGGFIYGIINSIGLIGSSNKIPTSQTLTSYIVVMIMIAITFLTFLYSKIKSDNMFKSMPKVFQDINEERFKYTALFGLFVILLCGFLIYNPFDLVTKYGGASIFIILFFSLVMFSMIYVSDYFLRNPSMVGYFDDVPGLLFITKLFSVLTGLVISGAFIYWILRSIGLFDKKSIASNIGGVFLNIFMLVGLLGVSYKLITLGGFFENNPFVRLITSTLLYIPCLFVSIWNKIMGTADIGKPSEFIFLFISLFLFIGYFVFNYYIYPKSVKTYYDVMLGGEQILNKPVSTNKKTNVSGYQDLNGDDKFSYEHAISFWTYIDAYPPSTNSSYTKPTPIFSYGDYPSIKYDAMSNSLIITVPSNDESPMSVINITKNVENKLKRVNERNVENIEKDISREIDLVKVIPNAPDLDSEGNKIICKIEDFELQKWNNIVINCSGETLDIFYNGSLIKSTINTIPYLKYDMLTVGTDNGIIGKVANIMYYKKSLDYLSIHRLYSFFKDKAQPIIE